MSAAAADRRAMLAKVHIAKKDLAVADESYRALLMRVTGRDSSATCSIDELDAVLKEFARLGWKGPARASGRATSRKSWVRLIWALWGELAPLLDDADEAALNAFVRKQAGVDNVEWLTQAQSVPVIHGLRGWLEKAQRRGTSA